MNALLRQARRARAWIDRRLERRIAAYAITAILGTSLLFGAASLAATLWIVRQHQRIDSEHRLDRIVVRLDDKVDLFVRHAQDLSKSSIIATALLDSRGRNIYLLPFFSHYRFPLAEPHGLALCDFEGKLLAQQKWHPINCMADLPQSRAVIGAEQAQALVIAIERRPHLVLFQPDGVIAKRIGMDIGPIKAAKRSLKLFDLDGLPCDRIGSLLVNEVLECKAEGTTPTPAECLDGLTLSALGAVKISK